MDLIIAMYIKLIKWEKEGMNRPDFIQRLEEKLKEARDEV